MLRFSVLSSGSSGNATYLEADGTGLLVDAGLSCRRLRALLARVGRSLDNVDAVLVTHGHSDHTSGLRSILRERPMQVYAAPDVVEDLKCAEEIEEGDDIPLGRLSASFFEVPHDTPTYGVMLREDGRRCALATDLGEVAPSLGAMLRGAEAVVLEANHDPDWLRRGPYSADLKRRVASGRGHLSNHQAAAAACDLAPHGLKDLVLAHLSRTNNSPMRATGTVRAALKAAGHGGVRVRAALAGHPTPWIEVGAPLAAQREVYKYDRGDTTGHQLFDFG